MTTLTIFDVEHGGCALLTCSNGVRMMIDCGHNASTGWYPGRYLRSIGVSHLHMLVVTNYDQDHISGFPDLIDQVTIGSLFRNVSVTPSGIWQLKSEDGIVSAAMSRFIEALSQQFGPPGSAIPLVLPGINWSAHWNAYPTFNDENNLSLVLRLTVGDVTLLFPGDLETAGWRKLLQSDAWFASMVSQTTVLVASHHGRDNGVCPELFEQYGCQPQLIVISDDYRQYDTQNTTTYYGSKCGGIRGFRGQAERRVLTTRNDGAITFRWDGAACTVV